MIGGRRGERGEMRRRRIGGEGVEEEVRQCTGSLARNSSGLASEEAEEAEGGRGGEGGGSIRSRSSEEPDVRGG